MRARCQNHGAPVGGQLGPQDRQQTSRPARLYFDGRITRPQRLEAVAGAHVRTVLDHHPLAKIFEVFKVHGTVEGDMHLVGRLGPGAYRLRRLRVTVGDFIELSLASGTAAPIGPSAMRCHDQIARGRKRRVDRQHIETTQHGRLGHVARFRFHQRRAIQLAARITAHDGVAQPPLGPKHAAARLRFVEA